MNRWALWVIGTLVVGTTALGAASGAGAAPSGGPSAPLPGYQLVATWPALTHGLPSPHGIAADDQGRVWVLDGAAGEAAALAPDGTVAARRSVPTDALDLAPGPQGDLLLGRWTGQPPAGQAMANVGRYAADYGASGQPVWARPCGCGTGSGVAATAGRVWLTEPGMNALTWMGAADGQVSGQLTVSGARDGFPADVAAAPDGTLLATDLIGDTVYVWPPPYLPGDARPWSTNESSGPFRVAAGAQADGEAVVAVMFSDGLVRAARPDGTQLARFSVPGQPFDLTVGAEARIYVLDDVSGEIRVYAPGAPPTPTPAPPDPPTGAGSCRLTGTRTLAPSRIAGCQTTDVVAHLTASCPAGAVAGAEVALVIDRSQSMRLRGQMDAAQAAARRFLSGLDLQYHRATIISFSNDARVDQPLTADRATLDAAVDGLTPSGSATNIHAALRTASTHIAEQGRPDALPVIVLMTDGEPNRPVVPEAATAALVAAERARARRAYIVTVGLGGFVDSLLLTSIASSPDDFYYAPEAVDLERIYDTILQVVQGISLTDLELRVTPNEPFVSYVAGSGQPPPLAAGQTLQWNAPALPAAGLTVSYTLKAGPAAGRDAIGPAEVRYTDADGTRRTFRFPSAALDIDAPAPPPGGGTPAPTAPPVPPAPPTPQCPPAVSWRVGITVWPDVVGTGGYACPGCNGLRDGGDLWARDIGPDEPAAAVVRDAGGQALWVGEIPTRNDAPNRVIVPLCAPPPYTVTILRLPSGYVTCPNSPSTRHVERDDFALRRYAEVRFGLWPGCGTRPPPATPPPACP